MVRLIKYGAWILFRSFVLWFLLTKLTDLYTFAGSGLDLAYGMFVWSILSAIADRIIGILMIPLIPIRLVTFGLFGFAVRCVGFFLFHFVITTFVGIGFINNFAVGVLFVAYLILFRSGKWA